MRLSHQQTSDLYTPASEYPAFIPEGSGAFDTSLSLEDSAPLSVVPGLEVAAVSFSSPDYREARRLQIERYSRACKPGEDTYLKYEETVDVAVQQAIPLVVRRRGVPSPVSVIGTARLELPTTTSIEAIARFQPNSPSAGLLARGAYAEVGVFATRPGLSWCEVLDVIDTVVGGVVWLAQAYGLERLWLFPRRTLMSLLLADIPGLLPPYRFRICPDVVGWNEQSERLRKMRAVGMKEVSLAPDTLPIIFQIAPAIWAEDLARRLALSRQRQQAANFPRLLQAAMRQGLKDVDDQIARLQS